jgi:hypothetical protein
MELVAFALVAFGVGAVRPRWSALLVALVPAALAFVWLLMHEDNPYDPIGAGDLAWFAAMSSVVGAAFALVCALGVVVRRALLYGRARGAG